MDGVDEVSPFFKERVLRLLAVLKENTDNPIWLSCRPEVEASLLQELRCTATRLRALSSQEQRDYLCERLAAKHNNSDSEISSFVDKTIASFLQVSQGRSFLDIPLHLSMIAEVFTAEAPQSGDTFFQQNVFILLLLYRHFVEMKRNIHLEKHGLMDANLENLNMRDDFKEMHQYCAILYMLSESEKHKQNILNFKTYVEENIEKLKKEKSGMLWVDEENNTHFVHFTFAEYFSALWLFENRYTQTAKELTKYFYFERKQTLALRFLDLMLVEEVHQRVQLPLHEAFLAGKGDGEGVARALEEGAQVDAVDAGGRTALHLAASSGNWRAMEALLEAGCDGKRPDSLLGWTPLQYAQCWGYVSSQSALRLDRREAYTSTESLLTTHEKAIYSNLCSSICRTDCAKVALWLMDESTTCLYRRLLASTADCNARKVARALLLEYGARACNECRGQPQVGEEGVRPHDVEHQEAPAEAMAQAVIREHEELALDLLEHVSDVDRLIWRGQSVLHLAAARCLVDITRRLLAKGANARLRNPSREEPLHKVFSKVYDREPDDAKCAHYVQRFVEMLPISTHTDHTNARDREGRTPLHLTVDAGHVRAVEMLLRHGSAANATDLENVTPLHMAVKKRDVNTVKILLQYGADPSLIDARGENPLNYLYSWMCPALTDENAKDISSVLLEKRANPNSRNENGQTPIHYAAVYNHFQTLELFLKYGARTNVRDKNGRYPLHYANSSSAVRLLLGTSNDQALRAQHEQSVVNARDDAGCTPLHMAASRGDVDVMKVLVDFGADTNTVDKQGRTSLHLAAKGNSTRVIQLLICAGCELAALDYRGQGPLNYVYKKEGRLVEEDCDSTVALLLEKGSPPNSKDETGCTVLHKAVYNDHLKVVKRLLEHNALVNVTDSHGKLPLHYAVSADVVHLLLRNVIRSAMNSSNVPVVNSRDASVTQTNHANARDNEGRSPLHLAAERANVNVVKVLVFSGSQVNAKDRKGVTPLHLASEQPLHLASQKGAAEVMKFLVASGADTNSADDEGCTSLHLAVQSNSADAVQLLVEADSHTAALDHKGQGPLNYVYKNKLSQGYACESIVDLLLNKGSPPNLRDGTGRTPLHHAVEKNHFHVVERLLQYTAMANVRCKPGRLPGHYAGNAGIRLPRFGCADSRCDALATKDSEDAAQTVDVNARDDEGCSPLHLASKQGNVQIMNVLIASGSDTNSANKEGCTSLHLAVQRNSADAVQLLIEAGADIEALDYKGQRPLNYVKFGFITKTSDRIVTHLLDNESPPHLREETGLTLLHYAAQYDQLNVVERLVKHKELVNARDINGKLPLHYASSMDIVNLLLSDGVCRAEDCSDIPAVTDCEDASVSRTTHANARDNEGRSPLHLAVEEENVNVVKALVTLGSEVNAKDKKGVTPLHLATGRKSVVVMKFLVDSGADSNSVDNEGRSSLHIAALTISTNAVQLLVAAGSDPETLDHRGQGPLNYVYKKQLMLNRWVVEEDCDSVVALLLQKGSPPNKADENGWTPLHHATNYNDMDVVKRLLKHRAIVSARDEKGRLPLHYANSNNVVHLLLKGANRSAEDGGNVLAVTCCEGTSMSEMANARDNEGRSPLHLAAERANVNVVMALISSGSQVNAKDKKGVTPLHLASEKGAAEIMKFLVASGADTNSADDEGRTSLHLAVQSNSADAVQLLVEADSHTAALDHKRQGPLNYIYKKEDRLVQEACDNIVALLFEKKSPLLRDETGRTLLHYAAQYDQLNVVERLVNHKKLVNVRDTNGRLPLHYASSMYVTNLLLSDVLCRSEECSDIPVVTDCEDASVSRTAYANARDNEGRSPLHLAAERKNVDVVTALVTLGSEVNAKDKTEVTPLHLATGRNSVVVMKFLVDSGADSNSIDNKGRTSLHIAVYINSPEAVKLLIDAGSHTEALDNNRRKPLHYLYKKEYFWRHEDNCNSILSLFLGNGSPPNEEDESGQTPLHHAMRNDHLKVAKRLLEHKAQVDIADSYGRLPLHYARSDGGVELLLGGGASRRRGGGEDEREEYATSSPEAFLDARDEDGRSPLHMAAALEDEGAVKALVAVGANPNARDSQGLTPLHLAAFLMSRRVVETLVAAGADPNAEENGGWTPLHLAASEGGVEAMEVLVAKTADTNSTDNEGRTPLHLAVQSNSVDAVKLLIDSGSRPAALDNKGQGLINYIYKKESRMVEDDCDSLLTLLLKKRCPPNVDDESGRTPLHHAVRNDHLKVIKRLLDHKVQVDVGDRHGRLALHYARSAGAVALLLGDGASGRRAVDTCDKQGRCPLHLAAARGDKGAVEALAAAGSDPNARDSGGLTPLHLAVRYDNLQVVHALLDLGSRYDVRDDQGIAPLNYLYVAEDYVKELTEYDFEDGDSREEDSEEDDTEELEESEEEEEDDDETIDYKEEQGCERKNYDDEIDNDRDEDEIEEIFEETCDQIGIAALLLERGADPNSLDTNGRSVLHHAARMAHLQTVRVLLQHRTDVNLVDNRGRTARDLAQDGLRLRPWEKDLFGEVLLLLNGGGEQRHITQKPSSSFCCATAQCQGLLLSILLNKEMSSRCDYPHARPRDWQGKI